MKLFSIVPLLPPFLCKFYLVLISLDQFLSLLSQLLVNNSLELLCCKFLFLWLCQICSFKYLVFYHLFKFLGGHFLFIGWHWLTFILVAPFDWLVGGVSCLILLWLFLFYLMVELFFVPCFVLLSSLLIEFGIFLVLIKESLFSFGELFEEHINIWSQESTLSIS